MITPLSNRSSQKNNFSGEEIRKKLGIEETEIAGELDEFMRANNIKVTNIIEAVDAGDKVHLHIIYTPSKLIASSTALKKHVSSILGKSDIFYHIGTHK